MQKKQNDQVFNMNYLNDLLGIVKQSNKSAFGNFFEYSALKDNLAIVQFIPWRSIRNNSFNDLAEILK